MVEDIQYRIEYQFIGGFLVPVKYPIISEVRTTNNDENKVDDNQRTTESSRG